MYMTNINTKKKQKEDPKNPNTIAKNILKGFLYICLAILIFAISSWQLSILVAASDCFFPNKKGKSCPYPGDENAPPYRGGANKTETPFQAFMNILMSITGEGLIGLSRGLKCCKPTEGGMLAPKNSIYNKNQRGGGKIQTGGDSSIANEIENINIRWGATMWRPFDIQGKNIGWPYSNVETDPEFSFNHWLGKSQITSWVIPRQMFQSILLFLLNFMAPAMGHRGAWVGRFLITLILPIVFCLSLLLSGTVALFSTIWGGFLQHIFEGNLASLIWGFFCTWALIIFNMIIQPTQLFASLFMIPAMRDGMGWLKANLRSVKRDGYREIVLTTSFIAFACVVLYNLMPLMNKN